MYDITQSADMWEIRVDRLMFNYLFCKDTSRVIGFVSPGPQAFLISFYCTVNTSYSQAIVCMIYYGKSKVESWITIRSARCKDTA